MESQTVSNHVTQLSSDVSLPLVNDDPAFVKNPDSAVEPTSLPINRPFVSHDKGRHGTSPPSDNVPQGKNAAFLNSSTDAWATTLRWLLVHYYYLKKKREESNAPTVPLVELAVVPPVPPKGRYAGTSLITNLSSIPVNKTNQAFMNENLAYVGPYKGTSETDQHGTLQRNGAGPTSPQSLRKSVPVLNEAEFESKSRKPYEPSLQKLGHDKRPWKARPPKKPLTSDVDNAFAWSSIHENQLDRMNHGESGMRKPEGHPHRASFKSISNAPASNDYFVEKAAIERLAASYPDQKAMLQSLEPLQRVPNRRDADVTIAKASTDRSNVTLKHHRDALHVSSNHLRSKKDPQGFPPSGSLDDKARGGLSLYSGTADPLLMDDKSVSDLLPSSELILDLNFGETPYRPLVPADGMAEVLKQTEEHYQASRQLSSQPREQSSISSGYPTERFPESMRGNFSPSFPLEPSSGSSHVQAPQRVDARLLEWMKAALSANPDPARDPSLSSLYESMQQFVTHSLSKSTDGGPSSNFQGHENSSRGSAHQLISSRQQAIQFHTSDWRVPFQTIDNYGGQGVPTSKNHDLKGLDRGVHLHPKAGGEEADLLNVVANGPRLGQPVQKFDPVLKSPQPSLFKDVGPEPLGYPASSRQGDSAFGMQRLQDFAENPKGSFYKPQSLGAVNFTDRIIRTDKPGGVSPHPQTSDILHQIRKEKGAPFQSKTVELMYQELSQRARAEIHSDQKSQFAKTHMPGLPELQTAHATLPGPANRRQFKLSDPIWEYKDFQGRIQGSFASLQMRQWFEEKFFPPALLMRCDVNAPFVPFSDLYPRHLYDLYPPFLKLPPTADFISRPSESADPPVSKPRPTQPRTRTEIATHDLKALLRIGEPGSDDEDTFAAPPPAESPRHRDAWQMLGPNQNSSGLIPPIMKPNDRGHHQRGLPNVAPQPESDRPPLFISRESLSVPKHRGVQNSKAPASAIDKAGFGPGHIAESNALPLAEASTLSTVVPPPVPSFTSNQQPPQGDSAPPRPSVSSKTTEPRAVEGSQVDAFSVEDLEMTGFIEVKKKETRNRDLTASHRSADKPIVSPKLESFKPSHPKGETAKSAVPPLRVSQPKEVGKPKTWSIPPSSAPQLTDLSMFGIDLVSGGSRAGKLNIGVKHPPIQKAKKTTRTLQDFFRYELKQSTGKAAWTKSTAPPTSSEPQESPSLGVSDRENPSNHVKSKASKKKSKNSSGPLPKSQDSPPSPKHLNDP